MTVTTGGGSTTGGGVDVTVAGSCAVTVSVAVRVAAGGAVLTGPAARGGAVALWLLDVGSETDSPTADVPATVLPHPARTSTVAAHTATKAKRVFIISPTTDMTKDNPFVGMGPQQPALGDAVDRWERQVIRK